MIKLTLVLEDHVVTAERGLGLWDVSIEFGGHIRGGTATDEEFGAIMALAVGGDEIPGADELYPIAEEWLEEFTIPESHRIIP